MALSDSSHSKPMGYTLFVCLFSLSFISSSVYAKKGINATNTSVNDGTVLIDGRNAIASTSDDFICATLDWWPPEKCDFGSCSWANSGILNLDLKNKTLLNAVKAFSPLKIRMGGTLEDRVIYQTEDNQNEPCNPFALSSSEMFHFTEGCLSMARWDELNSFFNQTGALVVFGLNILYGKTILPHGKAVGAWNSSNAQSFIRYTVQKGYNIYGWELGNELCGNGIGARVSADNYASDIMDLYDAIYSAYNGEHEKPLIMGPGGFFNRAWFQDFISQTDGSLDVVTHHVYNLGLASDKRIIRKILNPSYLAGGANVYLQLKRTLESSQAIAVAWVSESGGAAGSGRNHVSNTFVYSFWYLDQLGMASVHDTKTYCRQSLIGGNYGLLDTTSFIPNPDYYSALLWHRLMGSNVLSTKFEGTKMMRAYAHCSKQCQGITLLLINLDDKATVKARVQLKGPQVHKHKYREEYHLTPKEGNIQSQTALLNGEALVIRSSGEIPALRPIVVPSYKRVTVLPHSIVFVHIPNVSVPACTAGSLI